MALLWQNRQQPTPAKGKTFSQFGSLVLRRRPPSHTSSWKSASVSSVRWAIPDSLESESKMSFSTASAVRGGSKGGCSGEGEPRLRSKALTPSIPRKISGVAPPSSFSKGGEAGVSVFVAALLLDKIAARWLALEATRLFLARLVGCVIVTFLPLEPAATGPAALTALAVVVDFAGSAATAAKDLVAEFSPVVVGSTPFTVARDAAGGGVVIVGGGCRSCCRLNSLHSLVLSMFLAHLLVLGRFFCLVEGAWSADIEAVDDASSLQQNSTDTAPCLLMVSSDAQTPLSTHSSKRARRREWFRLATGRVLVLEEGGE